MQLFLKRSTIRPNLLLYCSDVNKDLGPKAKDSISHKANVQRHYFKVKDDNDHKFYVFNS